VHGVLIGWFISGLIGVALMGLGRSVLVWGTAQLVSSFLIPIINGSNQAIWQSKVAPDIQGRVFSIRRLIAWFVVPLATLIAGPLADNIFEPTMQTQGAWMPFLSGVVGSGPGAGMAVLFVVGGIGAACIGLSGYAVRAVRNAETILPDFDALKIIES
jgi:hypothetical protein